MGEGSLCHMRIAASVSPGPLACTSFSCPTGTAPRMVHPGIPLVSIHFNSSWYAKVHRCKEPGTCQVYTTSASDGLVEHPLYRVPGTFWLIPALALATLPGNSLCGVPWNIPACTYFSFSCPAMGLFVRKAPGPPSSHTSTSAILPMWPLHIEP